MTIITIVNYFPIANLMPILIDFIIVINDANDQVILV